MNDYLLRFTDEAEAQAVLSGFYDADAGWSGSDCIPNVRVWTVTGTTTDDDGSTSETRTYAPGWFIRVNSADGIDPKYLYTVPDGYRAEPVFATS